MSTTTAFPFVGARAQVGPNPTYGRVLHCRTIKAGSTVTVLSEPDEQGDVRAQREDGEWSWVAARHLSPVPVSPGTDQPTEHEDGRESSETNARALTLAIARLDRDRRALARVKAERDAARAELAAAHNTDGLPKPYESVREVAGVLRIGHGVESCWANPNDNPNWHRYHAANSLALANEIERRARLADEATPKDKEHDR